MPKVTMKELLEAGVHFWTSNEPLEPENEAICVWSSQRNLYY